MKPSKLNLSSFPITVSLIFLLLVGVSILTSCGGKKHSVREIRDSRASYIPKVQERAMIQPLFLQSKKANIGLPRTSTGSTLGGSIVTEQVTYKNPDNHTDFFEENTLDVNKTYGLSEVVVEARSRFTPERDGKIDVDFIVRVPRELIDRNWMLKLQPFIIHRDSLQLLDPVVVKGEQFSLKQKLDYKAYEDYLGSIVAKKDYDSVFLNHAAIESDIKARQEFYYERYHKDWALHREYEVWMDEQKAKVADEKAIIKGDIAVLKYDFMRRLLSHSVQDIARGVDTTGLAASYNMEFLRKSNSLQKRLDKIEMNEISIPKRYQEVHAQKISSRDIENLSMTAQDTLDIAKNRYMFDAIVENEMKEARKEIVKQEMIPFPYESKVRLDTAVFAGRDFAYYYRQEIPVTQGLKSVNIAMETQVTAIDASKFNMRRSDTLSYFISSIVQLVDTTLMHQETVKNRNATHRQTAYFQYRPNTWRFDPKYKNNATELDKIIKDYDIFEESKGYVADSILMQMSTSLEGEYQKNAELSMKRVEDLKKYLSSSTKMGKSQGDNFFTTRYIGEDWNALVRLIRSDESIVNKDAIIDILGNATNPDKAKEEVKTTYKADFDIIREAIYPQLDKVDMLFYVHRTDMTSDSEVIRAEPQYIKGVRLLQNRQYGEAMEILANYPDFNAAVCLAALGYNAKAYEVLAKQKANGNTEYLSAIVAWRIGQKDTAATHLLKAVELDQSKIYRLGLDPDINDLIQEYKLQEKINKIHQ